MTLKKKTLSVIAIAMTIALIAVACGETTEDIVATNAAQNRADNDAATRQAIIDAGGDPDNPQGPQVGDNSEAARRQQAAKETATALALVTPTPTPTPAAVEIPDGPALTDADDPVIEIGAQGSFTPDVIKVASGTTVRWENPRRSASSTKALEGEAEQWDSGSMSKGTFDTGPATFEHTFTIPGCHKYASFFSGDSGEGAVCVE